MTDDLTNRLRAAVEQGGRLDLVVAVLLTAEARDLLDEVDGERPSFLVCRGTPEGHAEWFFESDIPKGTSPPLPGVPDFPSRRALVLYSPARPILGMLRAMTAAGMDVDVAGGCAYPDTLNRPERRRNEWSASFDDERGNYTTWPTPPEPAVFEPGREFDRPAQAWGLGQRLVLLGKASEVLVLLVRRRGGILVRPGGGR